MAIPYLQPSRTRIFRPPIGRHPARRTIRLALELLEYRLVLSPAAPTITLDPANDEYGAQIQTVTQLGDSNRVTLGILDTGASPITVAPADQAGFANAQGGLDPIPVKTAGGASADGIGGSVTGDVSSPISVLTDGLHAATLNIDFTSLNQSVTADFTQTSVKVNGIQAFIGTDTGSPDMPTISGTPIFAGGFNSSSRTKLAAKVDLINGVDLYGIGLLEPDVHFVPATTRLVPAANELLATIPMARIGGNTVPAPGTDISSNYNFISGSVQLNNTASNQVYSVSGQQFLLDTGSQMTVVSTAEANALHIDLSKPFDSIQIQGVGGTETVNGYIIDSLQVGLVGAGPLTFKNVPVFVLDAAPGQIDGILGMNLWNNVDQMLIDPFTPFGATSIPTLSIAWDPNYTAPTNPGAFGFNLDELLSGHAAPLTLSRLLGGAAQDFRVPLQIHALAPVSTPTHLANGGTLTADPMTPGLAEAVVSATVLGPTDALPLTINMPSTLAAANPIASVAVSVPLPTVAAASRSTSTWGCQPLMNAADGGSRTADYATELGMDNPQAPNIRTPDQESEDILQAWVETSTAAQPQADNSLSPGHLGTLSPCHPATLSSGQFMAMGPRYPLAEAALLAALGLVVRDYWLQDSHERHVRARIEAARRLRFDGLSFSAG